MSRCDSCFGWDATDSTESLQLALSDAMVSTLIVDVPPDPVVGWVVRPLFITRDDLTVIFEDGVLLHARKGHFQGVDGDQASLLTVYKASNVTLEGRGNATLRMRREDYLNASLGYVEHSEWRMGINLLYSSQIRVHGLRVEDTGGDGIYVLGYTDIHISDCVLDRNFRQGMSVINASNLLVERTTFSNTDGTPPMAGIDMEPDSHCMMFVNVTIRDSTFIGNSGFGWILSPSMLNGSSRDLSIVLENITVSGGATRPPPDTAHPAWRPGLGLGITGILQDGTLRPDWGHGATGGSVLISNSTVSDTWGSGLFITSKGAHAATVTVSRAPHLTVAAAFCRQAGASVDSLARLDARADLECDVRHGAEGAISVELPSTSEQELPTTSWKLRRSTVCRREFGFLLRDRWHHVRRVQRHRSAESQLHSI